MAVGVRDGDVEARRALSLREQPALGVQVVCKRNSVDVSDSREGYDGGL